MSIRKPPARRGFARIGLMTALALLATSLFLAASDPRPAGRVAPTAVTESDDGVIGARVRAYPTSEGYIRVRDVFPDMPAEHAGLQPGDLIVAVDGQPVSGMWVEDVVRAIRGEVATPVRLHVRREDGDLGLASTDVEMVRVQAPGWYQPIR